MAVAPTGAIYKALEFDGVSSRTYGVYITGEAVYNAPERDVEMITIPGRNGSFALDNGRFQNIEVSYPAGIFADTEADFREAISDFRNFLCSRKGYVRLQDEYNPNEYRMAVYKSGLEVTPAMLKAGEFTITFDCKPQRWLKSGETAVTIGEWGETETASGDIVTVENPNGVLAVKSLEVDLEPIQDLNGYDNPWVGGAGKNKLQVTATSQTVNGVTFTVNSDGTVKVNGTATANASLTLGEMTLATNYILNGCPQGGGWNTYVLAVNGGAVDTGTGASGTSISDKNVYIYVKSGQTVNNLVFKPMIRLASETDATYEPYSNVCPISGHTDVDVVVSPTTDAADGMTYTTPLGRTVYGGTLDVVSGVLTVDRAMVTYNGTEGWILHQGGNGRYYRDGLPIGIDTASKASSISNQALYADDQYRYGAWFGFGGAGIYVNRINADDTIKDFRARLASNPLQVCYELATPQTYQLTAQQIELLTGTNNIWSDSGDVTVEYGQNPNVLINPTLFETGPLMEVEGYGGIIINGEEISLESTTLGNILISNGDGWRANNVPATQTVQPGLELLNNGDAFSIESVFAEFFVQYKMYGVDSASLVDTFGPVSGSLVNSTGGTTIRIALDTQNFTKGTSVSDIVGNMNYHIEANGGTATASPIFGLTLQYSGNNSITIKARTTDLSSFKLRKVRFGFTTLIGNSSKSALGNPTYIDLNDGEVYGDISGITVDLNKIAVLPAELPVLGPGNNTITYDNTITELKIVPRWWKV